MNELSTDIKALQDQTLNNLKNSKANNTIRAYRSDFRDFSIVYAINGLFNNVRIFFLGTPLEPPLAGIIHIGFIAIMPYNQFRVLVYINNADNY